MAEWVESLKSKRAQLLERGARLGSALGSKRATALLSRVRAGTLGRAASDGRATEPEARRDASSPLGASHLGSWQNHLVTRLEDLLLRAEDALLSDAAIDAETAPHMDTAKAAEAPSQREEPSAGPATEVRARRTVAKRPAAKRAPKAPAPDATLPIEDYDTLTAKQVLRALRTLDDDDDRERIRAYETAHKARKTVLRALG